MSELQLLTETADESVTSKTVNREQQLCLRLCHDAPNSGVTHGAFGVAYPSPSKVRNCDRSNVRQIRSLHLTGSSQSCGPRDRRLM